MTRLNDSSHNVYQKSDNQSQENRDEDLSPSDDDAGAGQGSEENSRDVASALIVLNEFVEKIDGLLRILNLKLDCHLSGTLAAEGLANVKTILDKNRPAVYLHS